MNVILIGFMGAGKTTVGHLVAARLGFRFVDTDDRIEADAGKSIPEIFADDGEPRFRELESAALHDTLRGDEQVISTGGGIILDVENRKAIRAGGYCVWMAVTPETVWERVSGEHHRPLLQNGDPPGTIRRLLEDREPLYRETAHLEIRTDHRRPAEIADEILAVILPVDA